MPDADPGLMPLFAEALERTDPADWAEYLDGACACDAALRRGVEALLAAHDRAGRFLEPDASGANENTPAETLRATQTSALETPPCNDRTHRGTQAGRHERRASAYRERQLPRLIRPGPGHRLPVHPLEVLGVGGMGTVYRAEQTQPVKRQLALRLIKIGMDSRLALARLDAERQALALMDHPSIARVYDGGTTAAGQPFFVSAGRSWRCCGWCRRLTRPGRAPR